MALANASRSDRMASRVHDPGLKAKYVESTNQRSIADMARDLYPTPPAEDHAKADNADRQEQRVTGHSVELPDTDQKEGACLERRQIENLGGKHDDAKRQQAQASHNSVAQI